VLPTLKLVEESKIVKSYEIQDFKEGRDFYFLKLKLIFIDDSMLYAREYVSQNEYLYSYHWQDKNSNLIIRWDNSPHHKELRTFPHHKHSPELEESIEMNLEEILKVITDKLENV
jgi:hypothetical protein